MDTNLPDCITVTTGVSEEVYSFLWKIQNWVTVQESEYLVTEQKFQIHTGKYSDLQSTWIIGLRLKTLGQNVVTRLYIKLLNVVHESKRAIAKLVIELQRKDGCPHWSDSIHKTLSINEEFELDRNLGFNRTAYDWAPVIDSEGTLTFSIQLRILQTTGWKSNTSSTSLPMEKFSKASQEKLCKDFSNILKNAETSDMTIICSDGKKLNVHSAILGGRCSVFECMIRSKMSESETRSVTVDDISSETMKILLEYWYTGELSDAWCHSDNIVEFVYAAGKYQLEEVLEMLDDKLGNSEDDKCNLILLNLANKLSLKQAEAKLLKQIISFTNNVKNSTELLQGFQTS